MKKSRRQSDTNHGERLSDSQNFITGKELIQRLIRLTNLDGVRKQAALSDFADYQQKA